MRYDLQPYQCTYADCEEPNETFYDYNSWNMHEQRMHRRLWMCNFADNRTFTEQELYEDHVRVAHPEQVSKLLAPEFVSARESTARMSDRDCPICLRGFSYTHELQRHIARHLESIALLALPAEEDLESESDERSSLESQVAKRRRGITALSTSNDFPEESGRPPRFAENDDDGDGTGTLALDMRLTPAALRQIQQPVPTATLSNSDNTTRFLSQKDHNIYI